MVGINPEVSAHSHTHHHMHPDVALMLGQSGARATIQRLRPGPPGVLTAIRSELGVG